MNIVFFGSGEFGLPTLKTLAASHDVRAIVTQPDRPAGRKRRLTPTPIGAWADTEAFDGPVFKPENVNEAEIAATIRAIEADAWVVIAFGQKLSQPLLADRFAMNLHASRLPRWRGAAPIHRAILAGDAVSGNSVITLAERMDAGFVLGQSSRDITPTTTSGDLHDALADDGPALVERVLNDCERGTVSREAQDESLVTHAAKLSRDEATVDFSDAADACRRRINGYSPWPGVSATCAEHTLKLLRADASDAAATGKAPGEVIDASTGVIACGDGALRLLEVQPAGGRPMTWDAWARGRDVRSGCVLSPA